jgi:hypothetical protein
MNNKYVLILIFITVAILAIGLNYYKNHPKVQTISIMKDENSTPLPNLEALKWYCVGLNQAACYVVDDKKKYKDLSIIFINDGPGFNFDRKEIQEIIELGRYDISRTVEAPVKLNDYTVNATGYFLKEKKNEHRNRR